HAPDPHPSHQGVDENLNDGLSALLVVSGQHHVKVLGQRAADGHAARNFLAGLEQAALRVNRAARPPVFDYGKRGALPGIIRVLPRRETFTAQQVALGPQEIALLHQSLSFTLQSLTYDAREE